MHRYVGLRNVLLLAIALKSVILLWVMFIKVTVKPQPPKDLTEISEVSDHSELQTVSTIPH